MYIEITFKIASCRSTIDVDKKNLLSIRHIIVALYLQLFIHISENFQLPLL